jgi:hypothetical protein
MTVELNQDTAKELISFKLTHLSKLIDEILAKWDQDNTEDFIKRTKSGELEDAEMDAISLRQLDADYHRLKQLLFSIKRELE